MFQDVKKKMYEENIAEESKIDDLKEYSNDFKIKMRSI